MLFRRTTSKTHQEMKRENTDHNNGEKVKSKSLDNEKDVNLFPTVDENTTHGRDGPGVFCRPLETNHNLLPSRNGPRNRIIENHTDCYGNYFTHYETATERRGMVSEEYDIKSDISGLTRDSDFTVRNEEKENHRPSSGHKSTNKQKNRKKTSDTSMNKSSSLMANLSIFASRRGWRVKNKSNEKRHSYSSTRKAIPEQENKVAQVRSRSLSPDRSHAASLLSMPSQDMEMSVFEYSQGGTNQIGIKNRRLHKRSKSGDLRTHKREPSPTRLAHPYIQYQMEQLMDTHNYNNKKLISPEPVGTRLEDFAFRTPRTAGSIENENDRVEPLGKRLDATTMIHTPMTTDVYVDLTPPGLQNGPNFDTIASETANIETYQQHDEGTDDSFQGIEAEAEKLKTQLETTPTPPSGTSFTWGGNDQYSNRAKARLRCRLRYRMSSKSYSSNNDINAELQDIRHPPTMSIDGASDQETISSLDADKSDSFDWKAFANYLETRTEKVTLHRSKYRSFFNSPANVDVTPAGADDVMGDEPKRAVRRSHSTGELLRMPSEKSRNTSLSATRSKEYIEFSPRESGGFLQATCFQEKRTLSSHRRRKSLDMSTRSYYLDWVDIFGEKGTTMKHNDSHELNCRSKPSVPVVPDAVGLSNATKDNDRKPLNFGNDKAISKKTSSDRLDGYREHDDEKSDIDMNFNEGIYRSHNKTDSPQSVVASRLRTIDVVRQLPFEPTPSPQIEERRRSTHLQKSSNKPADLDSVRTRMSTCQRRKLISEFLAVRDGNTSKTFTRSPSDPPQVLQTSSTKPRVFSSTKVYEDFQHNYDVPTLGISPRSVISIRDSLVEPPSVACMRGGLLEGHASAVSTIASAFSRMDDNSGNKTHGVESGKQNGCLPLCKLRTLKICQESRPKIAAGYTYLPPDESSSSSSVHVQSVKLPVRTPATVASSPSRNTPSEVKQSDYFWSPPMITHQVFDQLEI